MIMDFGINGVCNVFLNRNVQEKILHKQRPLNAIFDLIKWVKWMETIKLAHLLYGNENLFRMYA